MKKVLAIAISLLLTLGMFAGSITVSAATDAAITVANVEVAPNATGTVTITATDFSGVAGMDLTVTFAEGLTLEEDTLDSTGIKLTKNDNYTLENNVLHIVDSFVRDPLSAFTVTVDVTATEEDTYNVTLDGKFANESENFITPTLKDGTVTVENAVEEKTDVNTTAGEEITMDIPDGYFVPMGGVYDSKGNYITKNADGNFIGNGESVTINYFKLPADGEALTTFGASGHKADESAKDARDKLDGIQFGSYVVDWTKDGYGTVLVIGDFAKFKNKYKNSFDTNEKLFNRLVDLYAANVESKYGPEGTEQYEKDFEEKRFLKLNAGTTGDPDYIYVTRVTQKSYMWHAGNTEAMQYALRVYGINTSKNYTAVGYAVKDSKFEFSANVKSASWSDFVK
ncbi:MAG: hypothetical protein MJ091_04135 [Clostridia bacterium]|nr:hypothetical protein [Clostridia bacterium]